MNSFGTVYYAYYIFFVMQARFGFTTKQNLMLSATYGLVYTVAAYFGGRISERIGFYNGLKTGFIIMAGSLLAGAHMTTARGQVLVMCGLVLGMCFTWPTLEALISENETPVTLPRRIGIYNLVWAGTGAVSYFTGGAMLDRLGMQSIFYVPIGIQIVQFALVFWLDRSHPAESSCALPASAPILVTPANHPSTSDPLIELNPRPISKARQFQRMAWLANPFAYIAINTLVASIPGIASRFALSAMLAGFVCSIWCFARLAAFAALWLWPGWHFKFRWLFAAFIALFATFVAILSAQTVTALIAAQIVFGAALGLIYYSSLFYSMESSDSKGEQGGIHEAAIGLGNFAGPAIGAASIQYMPKLPNSGAIGVGLLLFAGLIGLIAVRLRSRYSESGG